MCVFGTLDENCREIRGDVLGDTQCMPGINRPVRKNYPGGVDVICAVVLIRLNNGFCHFLSTDIIELCTLFDLIPGLGKIQMNNEI